MLHCNIFLKKQRVPYFVMAQTLHVDTIKEPDVCLDVDTISEQQELRF